MGNLRNTNLEENIYFGLKTKIEGFNRLKNMYIGMPLFQYNADDILTLVLYFKGFFRITSSQVI